MAEEILTLAYESGINVFDTAEVYAAGKWVDNSSTPWFQDFSNDFWSFRILFTSAVLFNVLSIFWNCSGSQFLEILNSTS